MQKPQNIIIIGASSGIGRELALRYGNTPGIHLGVVARRVELLEELAKQVSATCEIRQINMADDDRGEKFKSLLAAFDTIDLIIYASGYGEINPELEWPLCRETLEVNVSGFTEIINLSYRALASQKCGQLAVISSIGGLRGFEDDSGYSASKSYQTTYMEGLARKAKKERSGVTTSTILPGFVDTAMAKGDKFFWMCSPAAAAECIIRGLQRRSRYIFVTRRWRIIALLLRLLPHRIFERM